MAKGRKGKKSKMKWGNIALGTAAAIGTIAAGKYVYDAWIKPKPAAPKMVYTGPKVLSKADNDDGTQDGMMELLQFLNLPNVRQWELIPASDGTATTKDLRTGTPPADNAETGEIKAGDLLDALNIDPTVHEPAKKRLQFDGEVETRLKRALNVNTIAGTSAKEIYKYASTDTNGQKPTLADIYNYWTKDKVTFSAGVHSSAN